MRKQILALLLLAMLLSGCLEARKQESRVGSGDEKALAVDFNWEKNHTKQIENPEKTTDIEQGKSAGKAAAPSRAEALLEKVAPKKGVVLPAKWLGAPKKAVEAGAFDVNKYEEALGEYGAELAPEHKTLLRETSYSNIVFTRENAGFNLNMLWAIGLANRNAILTEGRISANENEKGRFASTGGWGLGKKNGRDLLASAEIITLTPEQQEIVEEVAGNTYRPCCNNPASFPDCNHGMASLALAEIMASQGATKEQIYDALLTANAYWFPQSYVNIAAKLESDGKSLEEMSAKELLGKEYSGYNGSARITNSLKEIPRIKSGGVKCAA